MDSLSTDAGFLFLWKLVLFVMLWQSIFKVSNNAIKSLFLFLRYFLALIGESIQNPGIMRLSGKIPKTYVSAESLLFDLKSDFMQFVVCPKCDSIYRQEDCIQNVFGIQESTRCLHKPNPARPNKCDTILLKRVKSGTSSKLLPKKVYPYYSLQKSLDRMSKSSNFIEIKNVKIGGKYAQDPN